MTKDDSVTAKFRAIRERSGLSMDELARAMGYSRASSIQRYEDPSLYKKDFLAPDIVLKFIKAVAGKGDPKITPEEVWALAQPEVFFAQSGVNPESIPLKRHNNDEVRELDARAGAGGGGAFDFVHEADDQGNQLASEVIKAHWSIPSAFLRGELRLDAAKAIMIEVTGDSGYDPSNPHAPGSVFPGDRVIVNAQDTKPTPPGPFLIYDGTGFVIKLCEPVHGSDPPAVRLSSRNPSYAPYIIPLDDGHIIVGRVVGRFTRM